MDSLPHHTARARLPSMRIAGEVPEKVRVIRRSRGTPLVGQTVSVFRHPVELIAVDGHASRSVEAIVDTGATFLTAPQTLLRELCVEATERVPLRLADGRVVERDLGEVRVRIMARTATTGVIFGTGTDPVLLGSHALEGLRLAVDPSSESLIAFTPLL